MAASEYESLTDDPEKCAITLSDAEEMRNQFRDSLKPAFKLLVDRVEEIPTDIESIDFSGCVHKSDLVRDDIIDITCPSSTRFIRLTVEDMINVGNVKVKIFVAEKDPQIVSITFDDSRITEYKGIDDETEAFRAQNLNNITLNDKIILIERAGDIHIAGATIESNTCARRMTYTVNDLAYMQDIQALDEKITALAEQSNVNDVAMLTSLNEEPGYYTKE